MEQNLEYCMYNVQGELICTNVSNSMIVEPFDSTAAQNKRQSLPDILNSVIGNSNVCSITMNTTGGQVEKVSIVPCSRG